MQADVAAACYSEDPRFSLSGAAPATQAQAHLLLHPQHQGDSQLMHHPIHLHHPPVFQVESQVSEHRKQQPKRQRRYGNGHAEPARRPQHSKPTRKCQVSGRLSLYRLSPLALPLPGCVLHQGAADQLAVYHDPCTD